MKAVNNVHAATHVAAVSDVPREGQLIGDRYRLDRPLERGAMGSVWRAEQVRLRAPVAIKFLDPSLTGDAEMHERFMQEARSAAAVRSAHVVQVFDYGSEGGVPYIAMELLDGENLDARLGRGVLTPTELDKIFAEVARGISQAHAMGVIHRDLKPGNIFIAREGEHEVTKLVDFGIAKVKANALKSSQVIGTQLGTLLGTPQYMSPEQVRGSSALDHRTDLWALAIIACECLTGRYPFSGTTLGDLTVQICTEKPLSPSALGPVPPGFDQWFFKATRKKPNKRFPTAQEMARALHRILAPEPLLTPVAAWSGRIASLPLRAELRLAGSALASFRASLSNGLRRLWIQLKLVVHRLAWEVSSFIASCRDKWQGFIASERLAPIRPVLTRSSLLGSLLMLVCGVALLGLSNREAAPASGSLAARAPFPAEPSASVAPSVAVLPPPTTPADDPPAVLLESGVVVSALPITSGEAQANPGKAPQAEAKPAPAAVIHRPKDLTPVRGIDEVAPPAPKPITQALARAAARILNAEERAAATAPKKPVARSSQVPPAAAPRAPAPKRNPSTQSKTSQSHPFDDRL